MNNPNNLKKGDRIFVVDAWEDDSGYLHNETAIVKEVKEDGEVILGWSLVSKKSVRFFLQGTDGYEAKDYNKQ